jgi:AraC family transcriptional regulator
MNPAQKALWYIESHLARDLNLDEIAAIGGVSRYHMVRAFAAATGLSVMRYVRARRLSEAAGALADGAPDILSVALDADYGSHEAFTRAFRERFGLTPDAARTQGIDPRKLQGPVIMDSTLIDKLAPPRFETGKPMLIAGPGERYTCESSAAIPGLWQRFHETVEEIPARIGDAAYGVCFNSDDAGNFEYIAGVEVTDFSDLPRQFGRVRIPQLYYAVFSHGDHVSTVRRTMNTIWNQWLPASGHAVADGPVFERYDARFDPRTGNGGFEIWIPLKR